MPEVIIPIIIEPCMPTSERYWLGPTSVGTWVQQLGADQHRVDAADEEEHADPHQVLDADDLVVGAQAEVAADPAALLLAQRRGPPEQARDGVVGEAEADQEADHAAGVAEQQRHVVLVRGGLVFEARPVDQVADPPAEVVAADPEDHRGEQVEAEQAAPHRRSNRLGCGCGVARGAHSGSARFVGSGR